MHERSRPTARPVVEVRVAFDRIRRDRTRGAQALASTALRTLGTLLRRWGRHPGSLTPATARAVARALEEAQPAMGPFLRWAQDWRQIARSSAPRSLRGAALGWLRRERYRLNSEPSRIVRTARQRFPSTAHTVVTLSRSRTVLRAITSLSRGLRPRRILVLESLPGGEGRQFATDFRTAGLAATVIPDKAGPRAVKKADLVVMGADAVFSDGSVAHKVGTRTVAAAASRLGVPVIVIAGRSKFTGRAGPPQRLPGLFDRTPARWIAEYWTDEGPLPGRALRRGTVSPRTKREH